MSDLLVKNVMWSYYQVKNFLTIKQLEKRTKENGFGEAGAYLNGETVQEVGGGVCQTSSTLYNAVVLSNFRSDWKNKSYLYF